MHRPAHSLVSLAARRAQNEDTHFLDHRRDRPYARRPRRGGAVRAERHADECLGAADCNHRFVVGHCRHQLHVDFSQQRQLDHRDKRHRFRHRLGNLLRRSKHHRCHADRNHDGGRKDGHVNAVSDWLPVDGHAHLSISSADRKHWFVVIGRVVLTMTLCGYSSRFRVRSNQSSTTTTTCPPQPAHSSSHARPSAEQAPPTA